jgi:hypothetical protein
MNPEMQGVLIGSGATAIGALIGFLGARAQARSALEAVRMQVRGQRYDNRWHMQREAYASFFQAVEQTSTAIGHAAAAATTHQQHPGTPAIESPSAARTALSEAMKDMWLQRGLLRLSVTPMQMAAADSLAEQVTGVIHDLDAWLAALSAGDPDEQALKVVFHRRVGELRNTVEWGIDTAKGYLDVAPDVDRPRRSLWRRARDAYYDWRLGGVLD